METYDTDIDTDAGFRKESIITIFSALKHIPDKRVFPLLNGYFFNSDTEISTAAIRAAASESNHSAVSHLFQLIERAKLPQKIEAAKALAVINDPSSVEGIIKYFPILSEIEVKREILRAVNSIAPSYDRAAELNLGILMDEGYDCSFKEVAIQGIIGSGDFLSLSYHIPHAAPPVQNAALKKILTSDSVDASLLLKRLEGCADTFSETTLGLYLCGYLLKVRDPKINFMINLLQNAKTETISTFLDTLSGVMEQIPSVKKVFRVLLLMPYGDAGTEKLVCKVLREVIDLTKHNSPRAVTELVSLTSVYLDTLNKKIRESHLSLKGVKERSELLVILLAQLFERVLPAELLTDVQDFFKDEQVKSPVPIIKKIKGILSNEEEAERKRFEACLPLFRETGRIKRFNIYSTLKEISPEAPAFLKRFRRIIKAVGWLEIKPLSRKIWEILRFSREERMTNLETTCIITLCEIFSRNILLDYKEFFNNRVKGVDIQLGYVFGARFLPPESVAGPLLKMFFNQGLDIGMKSAILDTMKHMDFTRMKSVPSELIRVFDSGYDKALKETAGKIISRYGDSTLFHTLIDLSRRKEKDTKVICIRILREIGKREKGIPADVFTNRLYSILDDKEKQVQIESLLILLELGDDYAVKILRDWLESDDELMVPLLITKATGLISHEILPDVLRLVKSSKIGIQKTLRNILPDICEGELMDEVRRTLLNYLKVIHEGTSAAGVVKEEGVPQEKESIIHHPKIEFRFRREHSQVLTVFFIDIVNYTERSTRVDMSSLMRLVKTFEDIVIKAVEGYNGHVIKKMGDAVLAAFKHPVNAAMASLKIQEKIADHNRYTVDEEKFFVRIGLHTGSTIRKDGDLFGDVVNIASRMETAAPPGGIMITETTYNHIKDYVRCKKFGSIKIKGVSEEITAYAPEQVLIDIEKIMAVSRNNRSALPAGDVNISLEKLKESLFSPRFSIPRGKPQESGIIPYLKELFVDMANAVESISNDYHEEYVFKKYLQDKWNEMVKRLRNLQA